MRRVLFQRLLMVGLLAIFTIGCQSADSNRIASASGCQPCKKGLAGGTVWCNQCNAGFVKGNKTTCKSCYLAASGGPKCKQCTITE